MFAASLFPAHVGTAFLTSAVSNGELAPKDQSTGSWHVVESWTISVKTTGDTSSDQRRHLVEPQPDDSRPITDLKTRKRKKITQRLKKLLLLIFVSGSWNNIILLPKCILNVLVASV